jgi:hypothetical protein
MRMFQNIWRGKTPFTPFLIWLSVWWLVDVICEGQGGEEAVWVFLLPRQVTSSDSDSGFRLVNFALVRLASRERRSQPGSPKEWADSSVCTIKKPFWLVDFKFRFGDCVFGIPGVCPPGVPLHVVQVSTESQGERERGGWRFLVWFLLRCYVLLSTIFICILLRAFNVCK